MRQLSKVLFFGLLFCGVFLSSCSVRVGDFTIWSSKNAELGGKFVKTGRFEAKSMTRMILFIPISIANLKEAVDKTIEAGGGDVLTNAVLFETSLPLFVYNEVGYKIEADVWKKASVGDLIDPTKEVFELQRFADGNSQLVSTKNISKVEKVFNAEKYASEHNIPAN